MQQARINPTPRMAKVFLVLIVKNFSSIPSNMSDASEFDCNFARGLIVRKIKPMHGS